MHYYTNEQLRYHTRGPNSSARNSIATYEGYYLYIASFGGAQNRTTEQALLWMTRPGICNTYFIVDTTSESKVSSCSSYIAWKRCGVVLRLATVHFLDCSWYKASLASSMLLLKNSFGAKKGNFSLFDWQKLLWERLSCVGKFKKINVRIKKLNFKIQRIIIIFEASCVWIKLGGKMIN